MNVKLDVFKDGVLVYSNDTRNINDVKKQKKLQVNEYRDYILQNVPVIFQNNAFAIDEKSRNILSNLMSGISANISLPKNFSWRTVDNINVAMTEKTLKDFASLVMQYMNDVYHTSWEKKNQIDNLDSLEQLDSFDPFQGWPSTNLTPDFEQ